MQKSFMVNRIDITIESLGVGLELSGIENQLRLIGEFEARGYEFLMYKPKLKWDDRLFIYGFETASDTSANLYFNNGYLSRTEYFLYCNDYEPFLTKLKELLPKAKFIEDPFVNFKSTFCKYNDIAIELVQHDSLIMILRISDYWQFYN